MAARDLCGKVGQVILMREPFYWEYYAFSQSNCCDLFSTYLTYNFIQNMCCAPGCIGITMCWCSSCTVMRLVGNFRYCKSWFFESISIMEADSCWRRYGIHSGITAQNTEKKGKSIFHCLLPLRGAICRLLNICWLVLSMNDVIFSLNQNQTCHLLRIEAIHCSY